MIVLKIIETAAGIPSPFDGQYVAAYDPTWHRPDGSYDGGMLRVTPDPAEALQFESVVDALAVWRRQYGTRPDGKPNRPLTAFTVEMAIT